MATQEQRRSVGRSIILMLVASSLLLFASPVQAEETGPVYSANVSATQLNLDMRHAPPNYFAAARFDVGGDVTVVITALLGALVAGGGGGLRFYPGECLRLDIPLHHDLSLLVGRSGGVGRCRIVCFGDPVSEHE